MRKIPGWVWLLGLGAGAYALYRNSAAAQAAGAAASLAPGAASGMSPAPAITSDASMGLNFSLPGSQAPSMAQLATGSTFWSQLTPTSPPSSGYINLPSGTQVAAAEMGAGNTAMDANGNVYILWAGQVYALGFPDAQGNWPATLVNS